MCDPGQGSVGMTYDELGLAIEEVLQYAATV
jgi:hypothetical protein